MQTYGVAAATMAAAKDVGSEPIECLSRDADESQALLGRHSSSSSVVQSRADGHATLFSSISNLLNTIIGSGEHYLLRLLTPNELMLLYLLRNAHFPFGGFLLFF